VDKNFINIDLDDPKTGIVAEALSNKTCVKILSLLAEQELTASDISSKLKIPLNTTGYNVDKLVASGLIEKSSKFFWSVKGKKTVVYKVANKKIIISPKRYFRGLVPAVIVSGVFALVLRSFMSPKISNVPSIDAGAELVSVASSNASLFNLGWVWFIAGSLFSLIVAFLWDWLNYKGILK